MSTKPRNLKVPVWNARASCSSAPQSGRTQSGGSFPDEATAEFPQPARIASRKRRASLSCWKPTTMSSAYLTMIMSPVASRRRQRSAQNQRRNEDRCSQAAAKSPNLAPSLFPRSSRSRLQGTSSQPFLDEPDDALVADPMFKEADNPLLGNFREERSDIGVQYVVHLLAADPDNQLHPARHVGCG